MGGFHIAQPAHSEKDSIRLVRSAIDRGISFMDNSWDYNKGRSEVRMGKALKDGYRQKVFLMTKMMAVRKRSRHGKLKPPSNVCRLITSICFNTMKSSGLTTPTASSRKAEPMKQFIEAKKAGKIRYIGFTGHKDPHIHLYMLRKWLQTTASTLTRCRCLST